MLKLKIIISLLLTLILLNGCGLTGSQVKEDVHSYDFGLPMTTNSKVQIKANLVAQEITAPSWLDSNAILYRLGYKDIARVEPYANSRWVAAPGAILTLRLRQALLDATPPTGVAGAGIISQYRVRIELEEFTQIFDSTSSSHVLVRARSILTRDRVLVAQRSFNIERPAPSPDAAGAVKALSGAGDELVKNIVEWLATSLDAPSNK